MDRAKELVQLARLSGADYVKFQKRNPDESVPEGMKDEPHPNARFAYGDTYLEHRLALELNIEQHRELKTHCEGIGIDYASSVWDITSARQIISLSPDYVKVPSACNMDEPLLTMLANEYEGDIHISTGMIMLGEKIELCALIVSLGIQDRTVLYHCTSEYPCPFEHLYLLELEQLQDYPIKAVGFSNHGYGIAADIVAYMLGAAWIERHFVDDRTFPHTDASASLEPDGLRRLCRDLKAIRKTLKYKETISEEELKQRKKLRVHDD
ncbi:MAG: N-acetylneuraminate synthase family protein [Promethearchaeota archaeon]